MRTLPKTRHATFGSILCVASLGVFAFGPGCSAASSDSAGAEQVGEADEHVTAAQCEYFDVNGKVTICHYTGSANHPYTVLKISDQSCINGHAAHAHDYVAVNDPTCQRSGCLPVNAPCDATLPCCDGTQCINGVCKDLCEGVTCTASDTPPAAASPEPWRWGTSTATAGPTSLRPTRTLPT